MMRNWHNKIMASIVALLCLAPLTTSALPNLEGIQIYHKDVHMFPESKQGLQDDIDRYRNAEDLWDVLRQQFALNHYEDMPGVQAQINWFMQHQDFLLNSAQRAAPYLYYILQQSKKRNLPAEIVLLPIIESAFNPFAYSPMGAAGIWQMMPGTASGYGLHQDWWYDGRRDVITSTKAALNYLSYLGSYFQGNWLLAIAAYDTGEGNVVGAIRKNIRDGFNVDFWSLPLAQETRDYVPRLLALATIIAHPETYPVYFPPVHNAPYLAQMDMGARIDLKHAAGLAGITLKKMMQLNPGYSRATSAPHGPHKLVLPIENVAQFTENLALVSRYPTIAPELPAAPTPTHHYTRLREFFSRHRSHPIQTAQAAVPARVRNSQIMDALIDSNTGNYQIQPGDTIYISHHGDDLDRIATHFHVSKKALLASNPLQSGGAMHPGVRLVIPTHLNNTQVALADSRQSQSPAFTW